MSAEKKDIKYIVRTLHLKRGKCWQCMKERQINGWGVCHKCWKGWMQATQEKLLKEVK
jgi:hypothetical protein